MQKAVFLDRDGTINRDTGYIKSTDEVVILDGVGEALRKLKEKSFLLIIVTNQSGIARGYYDEIDLEKVNKFIIEKLGTEGAHIDDIFFCPHHPEKGIGKHRMDCSCRKPKPGLIIQAAEKYGIDLKQSFIIGDSLRDVEAGNRAGVRGLLIANGAEADDIGGASPIYNTPVHIGRSLLECTDWLLKYLETEVPLRRGSMT